MKVSQSCSSPPPFYLWVPLGGLPSFGILTNPVSLPLPCLLTIPPCVDCCNPLKPTDNYKGHPGSYITLSHRRSPFTCGNIQHMMPVHTGLYTSCVDQSQRLLQFLHAWPAVWSGYTSSHFGCVVARFFFVCYWLFLSHRPPWDGLRYICRILTLVPILTIFVALPVVTQMTNLMHYSQIKNIGPLGVYSSSVTLLDSHVYELSARQVKTLHATYSGDATACARSVPTWGHRCVSINTFAVYSSLGIYCTIVCSAHTCDNPTEHTIGIFSTVIIWQGKRYTISLSNHVELTILTQPWLSQASQTRPLVCAAMLLTTFIPTSTPLQCLSNFVIFMSTPYMLYLVAFNVYCFL